MVYIESPDIFGLVNSNKKSIFLAGGITDCQDWQQELVSLLANTELTVFNPRRKDFSIQDPNIALAQIEWEYRHLRLASSISFWFPSETLCPLTLYELGAWSMTTKPIYVGIHPDYRRRQDVEIQTKLARPGVRIVYSIIDLAAQIVEDMK